jgi:hypothetical protein
MKTNYRYRIETRRPGCYLRPLSHVPTIQWAVRRAVEQQAELPGGKTLIHDTITNTYQEWK